MSDHAENMTVSGLDQDWAAKVDAYDRLLPTERGELAHWLTERSTELDLAPSWIIESIVSLASTALLETGYRWAKRQEEQP